MKFRLLTLLAVFTLLPVIAAHADDKKKKKKDKDGDKHEHRDRYEYKKPTGLRWMREANTAGV